MKRHSGFTLIELLATLSIVGIVLAVGVPSFRSVIMNNRLASQANQFVASIGMTRSVAVRYQRNATVCPSANFDAPIPDCTATTNWSNGWIVWVDKDRDTVTDANEIISVFGPLGNSLTLTSSVVSSITYDARGFSLAGGDDLTLCDNRDGEIGRLIRINATGRTNVSRQNCS